MWSNHLTLPQYIDLLDKWGQVTNVGGSHHNHHHHNQHHHQYYQHWRHTSLWDRKAAISISIFALSSISFFKSASLISQEQVHYSVMDRLHWSSRAHYKVKYNWGKSKHCKNCKCSLLSQLQLNIILFRNDAFFYQFLQGDVNINLNQGGIHKLEDREVSWENMENINKMTQNTLFSGIYGDDWKKSLDWRTWSWVGSRWENVKWLEEAWSSAVSRRSNQSTRTKVVTIRSKQTKMQSL